MALLVATACLLLAGCGSAAGFRPLQTLQDMSDAADNSGCKPHQVHLAVTGDSSEMRIMWKTKSEGCPTRVHYGQDVGASTSNNASLLTGLGNGSVKKYSRHDMCNSPARDYDFDPPILHSVVLIGLDPGEVYSYKVAHADEVSSFRAPVPVGHRGGFQFLVYGDMGDATHKKAKAPGAGMTAHYVRQDVEGGADMILHVGDISYANGDPEVWDSFMGNIEPFAKRVPYMIAVGNHEYDYHTGHERRKDPSGAIKPYDPDWGNFGNDSGGECGVSVMNRFPMPGADLDAAADVSPDNHHHRPRPNPPFWYSYEYGSVHFTVISTEHDLEAGSQQYKWLKHDLSHTDRCRTPWLVLAMHRPIYVVYPHKSNRIVGEHLRAQLESLLNAFAVDVVFSGHVHSYARTCNVLDNHCIDMDDGGMTHITLGCGGHKISQVSHSQLDWLEYAEEDWGYGRVTVHDGRRLDFEFVRSRDGRVRDSMTLHNSRADLRNCDAWTDQAAGSAADGTAAAADGTAAAAAAKLAAPASDLGSNGMIAVAEATSQQ